MSKRIILKKGSVGEWLQTVTLDDLYAAAAHTAPAFHICQSRRKVARPGDSCVTCNDKMLWCNIHNIALLKDESSPAGLGIWHCVACDNT